MVGNVHTGMDGEAWPSRRGRSDRRRRDGNRPISTTGSSHRSDGARVPQEQTLNRRAGIGRGERRWPDGTYLIDQRGLRRPRPCARARTRAGGACSCRPSPRTERHRWPGHRHDRRAVVDVAGRGDGGPDTRLDRPDDFDDALAIGDERFNPIARTYLRRRLRRRSIHEDVAAVAQPGRKRAGLHKAHRAQPAIDTCLVGSTGISHALQDGTAETGRGERRDSEDRHAADDRSRPPPIDDVMTALRSRPG